MQLRERSECPMAVLTRVRESALRTSPETAPPLEAGRTLVDLFFDRVARWSPRPALCYMDGGHWRVISWGEYGDVEEMYVR
jgi:hypothetical protein